MAYQFGLTAIAFLLATALASEVKPKVESDGQQEEVQPTKRQAVYNSIPGAAQYAPQQQEVPPEFLNYLQQLSEQQSAALPPAPGLPHPQGQPQPQQLLAARGPQPGLQPQQGFPQYRVAPAQPPPPGVPRLSPQAEEQRRLQQEYADRPLREQQQRALQQLFQPATYRTLPVYAAQAQQQQPQVIPQQIPQQQYSPEELRALAEQQYISYEQPQYIEQAVASPQHQPQPQAAPPTQSKYYSQVQYAPQPTSHHKVRSQPQHQPQPQPTQTLFYSQQPEYYSSEQQTPTHPQLPEQYLIETSKNHHNDERVVSIPRPKPQAVHQAPQSIYYRTQQLQAQPSIPKYVEDNVLRSTTAAPSRSSIYVTKSGQEAKQALHYTLGETLQQRFAGLNQLNLPDTRQGHGQHPLSQTELNSLLQAGFQISSPVDSRRSLLSGPTYLRQQAGKRHNKRVPSPVPLTEDERHELAQQGIRNLYRVESAESQNSPVTYVLALDSNLKNGKHSRRSS